MDDDLVAAIETAPKQVLVEIVKLAQKQGRQGSKGGWKDFLNVYDPRLGNCFSDPAKRSHETLISFLKSFTDEENLKFVANILQCHSNMETLEQIKKESLDIESPVSAVQRLVHLTLGNPLYLSKYAFPSYKEKWMVTKLKKPKSSGVDTLLAIDCEMVDCEDGTSVVVRVCIVDCNLQVKLDKLVNPGKTVADYKSGITGVTKEDLDGVSCSLQDIQKSMKKLLKKGVILVGHSLYNDLEALKIDHKRVIDTSFIFKTSRKRTPSLSDLCKSVLGYQLREEGAPHNCLDDACAAMKLVLAKIDHGVEKEFPLIDDNVKDVTETDLAKLLLHGIPINVPHEELDRIFPQKFKTDVKPQKKAEVSQYSVFAVFESPRQAQEAFDSISGILKKDKLGLPQKHIKFELTSGEIVKFYVRKMASDDNVSIEVPNKKRASENEDNSGDAKKLKADQCCNYLEEIERLKQELRDKESNQCDLIKENEQLKKDISMRDFQISKLGFQISTQDKITADLKKRLEETKMAKKKGR